ncbi:HvfC/BufC N-terminal domain-containing protein [Burkholderia sp. S-53]|uniref:HvfC/BufC N-terminal domain-containing protein n=1 Tax=Burkholderia sp. S-53 TaxID=2906514 RepID=UPI0021CE63DD|nr:DNA-binding domain-containing protein [Burkholderia sp. S-53]UXU90086.1 DNA-binding domain-containing protein [Burkholderia sp. S-53]
MNSRSPTLAELQLAVRRDLGAAADDAAAWIEPDGLAPRARLSIYRNTLTSVLVNALRLAFPAVQRLVGAECFEGAARRFIAASPPRSAWLDEYGAAFPACLAQLSDLASIPYLADVAHVEWQVNVVLHAPALPALDLAGLASLDDGALGALRLRPHPAARLVRCDFPADTIWRAVLEQDTPAMHAIRLDDGPVHLLVQRVTEGVDVIRLGRDEHRIAAALFTGERVRDALSRVTHADGHALMAMLLARGCFVDAVPASDDRPHGGSSSCVT